MFLTTFSTSDFEAVVRGLEAKNQELFLKTTDYERSEADKARWEQMMTDTSDIIE